MFDDQIHEDPTGDIALRTTISDIVAKRDAALAKFSAAATALDAAYAITAEAEQIAKDAHHGKKYCGGHGQSEAFDNLHRGRFDGDASLKAARKELDARTWSFLIDHTGLDELMLLAECSIQLPASGTAKPRKRFSASWLTIRPKSPRTMCAPRSAR